MDEGVCGDREFDEEDGFDVCTVGLNTEPDVAATVTEDGSDDHLFGRTWCGG